MNRIFVRKRSLFMCSMVLTGLAHSRGRDGSGHFPSGKVPAGAIGDNAALFPRLVFGSESEAREIHFAS